MKGLSAFVSAALIILFSIVAVSLALTVLNPALDKGRDAGTITEAFRNLEMLDNTIKDVASEGENAKRTINLKVNEGTFKSDQTNNLLNYTYILKTDFPISGQRGNINITKTGKELTLFIIYGNIDINGTDHFTKGDNKVIIKNDGTNSTGYPIITIEK